jgi:hypothetical protein
MPRQILARFGRLSEQRTQNIREDWKSICFRRAFIVEKRAAPMSVVRLNPLQPVYV